jgi:hypothetical protein
MKITHHAAQRFLERVLDREDYTPFDIHYAQRYLSYQLARVSPANYARPFGLPGHKGYKVIHMGDIVVSIVPRDWVEANKPLKRYNRKRDIRYA